MVIMSVVVPILARLDSLKRLAARRTHALSHRATCQHKHTKQQRSLFTIERADLGDGATLFEWSPRGNLLAAAGPKAAAFTAPSAHLRAL